MNLRELQQRRAEVVAELRSITDQPAGSNGDLSEEQAKRFDELRAENERLEKSLDRAQAVQEAERRMGGEPVAGGDTYEANLEGFSIRKALAGAAGLDVDWGREREVGQEFAKRMGYTPQGVVIPLRAGETRATVLSDVSNLHPTEHMGGAFIDKLRSATVVNRAGARMLSDLTGDVEVPGMGQSTTAHWFGESEDIPLSKMGDRKVTLTPKHVGIRTELSRNTLLQTSPDVEGLVQDDMAAVMARAVDRAALSGSGSDGEPLGILERGIESVTLGAIHEDHLPEWGEILELFGKLEDADATPRAFITTPAMARKLRQAPRADDRFLMESADSLDGYPVYRSTHMAGDKLLCGDFSDVIVGQWAGVEVLANPYASGSYEKGNIQYRITQTLDVALRRPESFAVGELNAG